MRSGEVGSDQTVPALDGLRGVAILLVLLWHCASRTNFPPLQLGVLRPLVLMGWSGVDLFFALSGFLITKIILEEERASSGRFDVRRFYVRRALRIFPAFYLVLALDLLIFPLFGTFDSVPALREGPGRMELASLLTYWSNYYYSYTSAKPPLGLSVFWSLCVEEHFYLLWPAFLCAVRSPRWRVRVALGICVFEPALRFAAASQVPASSIYIVSHYRLDSILWGALGAFAFPAAARHAAIRRGALGLALAAVAVAAGGNLFWTNPHGLGNALGLSIVAVAATALVLEISADPRSPLAAVPAFAPLRWLGRVSYGVYLLHFQALDLALAQVVPLFRSPNLGGFLTLATVALAYGSAAAAAMYCLYERPFLALKARFTPPRTRLVAPPIPEAAPAA